MSDSLDPMDCSLPGSSSHGMFQARILEWVAISFSRIVIAFKSMIYLELFLYVQCELGVEVPFFHMAIQLFQLHLLKTFLSLLHCFGTFAENLGLVVKNTPANAGDSRDVASIPRLGRYPGGGHGNPLQYSCLENPMDRGAWWATVHRITKSQT